MSHQRVKNAIKKLDKKHILFWGYIPDVLEEKKIYNKKEIKEVLDGLEITNPKLRNFVYEQMELKGEKINGS